jgi:hypothetical protein
MTPKEKAKELVDKFRISKAITEGYGKQFALIAVDEILSVVWYVPVDIEYWQDVKKEIELL